MHTLRTVVEDKINKLRARIAAEIRAAQVYERDRAHQATCGDRPFVGCSPCEPAALTPSAVARENPLAKPRP